MTTAIDLFAGGGGFTEGAQAAGVKVLWAANHWPMAVAVHAHNHPGVAHACQDLQQANFFDCPDHDITLASPACQGHSLARGKDQPHHDAVRSTAWAVVSAAEAKRAPVLVVENVPEFLTWELYPVWRLALERLGYAISENVVDSANYGVPQHRVRAFVVATRSKAPFQLRNPRRAHDPIGNHIEWDFPKWSPINKPGRSQATLDRIASGRAAYGDRFVAPYYGSGSGQTGRSLDRPIGTVTTRDRWLLVDGDNMRMLNVAEYKAAMGFRSSFQLPVARKWAIHLLGNAVCPPVVTEILRQVRAAA